MMRMTRTRWAGLLSSLLLSACSEASLPSPVPQAKASVLEMAVAPIALPEPSEALAMERPPLAVFRGLGLDGPVAALHDPRADVYLVANLPQSGAPAFVTSVLPDGTVEALRWIDGARREVPLGQPASMAIVRDRVVISDGQYVRAFDRESGVYRGSIFVKGAHCLADLAVGARGEIFVTDRGRGEEGRFGTVFKVDRKGRVSAIAHSSVLGRPTGVVTEGSRAWIAAQEPEAFYGVAPDGGLLASAGPPLTSDALSLTQAGDQVIFSSVKGRALFAGPLSGPFEALTTQVDVSGDLGWDGARRRILVPCADGDRLELHGLPPAS